LKCVSPIRCARKWESGLVAPDRPGIGSSEFQAGRRLLDWPEDVAALADRLGIERFAVLGWSAGGPYALACAHAMPERVSRAGSVSGMAPINKPGAVAELGLRADRILFPLSARWPRIAGLILSLTRLQPARMVRRSLLTALSGTGDPDAEFLASLPLEDVSRFYFESLRSGGLGTAHDYRILGGDWGFPLADVSTEVSLWHGEKDGLLPLSHAQRLAEQLPHARLFVVPERGHFLPRRHMRRILSQLLES